MLGAGFILVIALFGAAGTHFVMAHLAMRKLQQGQEGAGLDWRRFRHPHRTAAWSAPQRAVLARAMRSNLYGFLFLAAGAALLVVLWPSL